SPAPAPSPGPGSSNPCAAGWSWPGSLDVGQAFEVGDREGLTAGLRIDAGGQQQLFGPLGGTRPSGQGRAQGLAALGEGRIDEGEQAATLDGIAVGAGDVDADESRIDVRGRPEHVLADPS